MKDGKIRLDIRVMDQTRLSRGFASELIRNGHVKVNGVKVTAPGQKVKPDCVINVKLPDSLYVGRGGYKLEHGLDFFRIDLSNRICADIGASTGGFTDCMLQRGAARVYAIENGKNQLAEKLIADPRVVSLEDTNINELAESCGKTGDKLLSLRRGMDFAAVDVSFISLTKVINAVSAIMRHGGSAVLLVKPQFEAGRGNIGKRGIVNSQALRERAVKNVELAATDAGLSVIGVTESPISGREGNKEYLMYCIK